MGYIDRFVPWVGWLAGYGLANVVEGRAGGRVRVGGRASGRAV